VEIIKFLKAIITTKDNNLTTFIFKKNLLDDVLQIFLENTKKGNLLHSCILNLFEMLTPSDMMYNSYGEYMNNDGPMGMNSKNFGLGNNQSPGFLQSSLFDIMCRRLTAKEKHFTRDVFFNSKYESGFKTFNRHLKHFLENNSEIDSKLSHDQNSERSATRNPVVYDTSAHQ
jgi:hypothetical protein